MFRKRFSRALAFTVISALFMASAAFADQLDADADALSTSPPAGNGAVANQQPGTTVEYDLSASVDETGNATDDVFKLAADQVDVTVTRSGDWLATVGGAGTPASFTFSNYSANQAGKIRITVPCGTAAGTVKTMTAVLTAGASYNSANAANSNGNTLSSSTQNLSWVITAQGADSASCAPANSQPQIAADAGSVTVDEASPAVMTGTWSDADAANTVSLSASVGIVGKAGTNAAGTWSWSYTPDDGPAESQTVTITADDGTGTANATNSATFELDVDNVAPEATLSGPSIAIVGQEVSYIASADDVSNADDAAGFTFSFDGGATWTGTPAATATYKTTFSSCGEQTVSVLAQDKDNGVSDAASVTTAAFNATFLAPLKVGEVNLVQKGRVIPVQISVSCDGNITGLSPTIQLLNGDYVSGVDVINSDDNLVTVSVSHADTSGVMREVDSKYLYNLQIPSDLTTGQVLTVRVRPWGTSGPSLNILLQIRK